MHLNHLFLILALVAVAFTIGGAALYKHLAGFKKAAEKEVAASLEAAAKKL